MYLSAITAVLAIFCGLLSAYYWRCSSKVQIEPFIETKNGTVELADVDIHNAVIWIEALRKNNKKTGSIIAALHFGRRRLFVLEHLPL